MSNETKKTQALERAQQLIADRMESVKALADTRAAVDLARAERDEQIAAVERETAAAIADAERADSRQYQTAIKAGWTAEELKKIGFDNTAKPAKTRKRAARKPAAATTSEGVAGSANGSPATELGRVEPAAPAAARYGSEA